MKTVTIELDFDDDEAVEAVEWLQRLLINEHPWIPGAFFAYVKDLRVKYRN